MHIATARDWDFHVLEANHTLFFVNDVGKHFFSNFKQGGGQVYNLADFLRFLCLFDVFRLRFPFVRASVVS